jgi:hypothetical protein
MVWQINLNNADLHSQFIISSLIYITHIRRFKINPRMLVRQQIIPREKVLDAKCIKCEPLLFGNSLIHFPEIMLEPLQKSNIHSLFAGQPNFSPAARNVRRL